MGSTLLEKILSIIASFTMNWVEPESKNTLSIRSSINYTDEVLVYLSIAMEEYNTTIVLIVLLLIAVLYSWSAEIVLLYRCYRRFKDWMMET